MEKENHSEENNKKKNKPSYLNETKNSNNSNIMNSTPLFDKIPSQLGEDPADLTLVRRILKSLQRACNVGAERFLDNYGRTNIVDLPSILDEANNYCKYIEEELNKYSTNNSNNSSNSMEHKEASSSSSGSHYRFPDEPLLDLLKDLNFIGNYPEKAAKMLVKSRSYQDTSNFISAWYTRITRTYIFSEENRTATENFIRERIESALQRLKNWDLHRIKKVSL